MKNLLLASCLAAVSAMVPLAAFAQVGPSLGGAGQYGGGQSYGGGGSGLNRGTGISRGNQDDNGDSSKSKEEKPAEPPPAIPGAMPNADATVIPADKVAAEMSPNDALFDAINRGDLAAAKDALNRGAQLESHNVLGQTPTDAAIDLSRNDITFLLLSMRGSLASSRPLKVASAGKPAHSKVVRASAQRVPARVLPADRGTPNLAVGFTGF